MGRCCRCFGSSSSQPSANGYCEESPGAENGGRLRLKAGAGAVVKELSTTSESATHSVSGQGVVLAACEVEQDAAYWEEQAVVLASHAEVLGSTSPLSKETM